MLFPTKDGINIEYCYIYLKKAFQNFWKAFSSYLLDCKDLTTNCCSIGNNRITLNDHDTIMYGMR
jgi:hypothetical protein